MESVQTSYTQEQNFHTGRSLGWRMPSITNQRQNNGIKMTNNRNNNNRNYNNRNNKNKKQPKQQQQQKEQSEQQLTAFEQGATTNDVHAYSVPSTVATPEWQSGQCDWSIDSDFYIS